MLDATSLRGKKPSTSTKAKVPFSRSPELYHQAYHKYRAVIPPLFKTAQEVDGPAGDFSAHFIEELNRSAGEAGPWSELRLEAGPLGPLPRQIILIDASPNQLPLGEETFRILRKLCRERGLRAELSMVHTREALCSRVMEYPEETLLLSQCADRRTYDVELAESLERRGVAIVPGSLTAPGGLLSDKRATYSLLSGGGTDWSLIPPYETVDSGRGDSALTAERILSTADRIGAALGTRGFFVKPPAGGAGRGIFRLERVGGRYFIPDLSMLRGSGFRSTPIPVIIPHENEERVKELLWVFKRLGSNADMAAHCFPLSLRDLCVIYGTHSEEEALRLHLKIARDGAAALKSSLSLPRKEAREVLASAIERYQTLRGEVYEPLVVQEVKVGLWTLRLHLRLGRMGPIVEALYARLFKLALTPRGVGLLGFDSISNPFSTMAEPIRYTPLTPLMVEAIGGKGRVAEAVSLARKAMVKLLGELPPHERCRRPLRVEFDMAPLSAKIMEGNADPVRGHEVNSRWSQLVRNTEEWLEDSLSYFAWRKTTEQPIIIKN